MAVRQTPEPQSLCHRAEKKVAGELNDLDSLSKTCDGKLFLCPMSGKLLPAVRFNRCAQEVILELEKFGPHFPVRTSCRSSSTMSCARLWREAAAAGSFLYKFHRYCAYRSDHHRDEGEHASGVQHHIRCKVRGFRTEAWSSYPLFTTLNDRFRAVKYKVETLEGKG